MRFLRIIIVICGVRSSAFCGIHIIYSGAVIRGDRQGLLSGKFEASRYGTHLLEAGSPIVEVRHRRIILNARRTVSYRPQIICNVARDNDEQTKSLHGYSVTFHFYHLPRLGWL